MIPRLIVVFLLLASAQRGGGGGLAGGGGPASMGEPTPFEQLVNKLKLDEKKQLPDVQRVFMSAAVDAEPIEREMTRLRLQMLETARTSGDLAPLAKEYVAQAAKMTAIEVRAFGEVRPFLKKEQLSKSTEAFALMAGLFHPPTPRGSRGRGRGGL